MSRFMNQNISKSHFHDISSLFNLFKRNRKAWKDKTEMVVELWSRELSHEHFSSDIKMNKETQI